MSETNNIQTEDAKDINELVDKIGKFKSGEIPEERFKHYRLTRGVYGQRQFGVHMFRTKLPFGKISSSQLIALANISDLYATGNLHLTTRQNIQFHYVKLDDSPKVWQELAQAGLTAREACGNTVRNITASFKAGIDPEEPFDVSPYAQATFEYFLRSPICQEMGRKIKIAFSSSEKDSAFAYIHDFGFIPKIKDGKRGFKVIVGGGLGAVSMMAQTAYEFLAAEKMIPFMEAAIRIFDRHGEREKRQKARMKFLVNKWGVEKFMSHVDQELKALENQTFDIPIAELPSHSKKINSTLVLAESDHLDYQLWKATNIIEQKQAGLIAVLIRVENGDLSSEDARALSSVIETYADPSDVRITMGQGLMIKNVLAAYLPGLYIELKRLDLHEPGAEGTADITACPGTDTCNLGVTNSMALSSTLSQVIKNDFPHLIKEKNLSIKISGCMNACGQHMSANIGFHGSSIKTNDLVIPAMQIVLGGGVDPTGVASIADKIIKIPSRRIPKALGLLFNHFEENAQPSEYYNDYYKRLGKRYFYTLLKPYAATDNITQDDLIDWGEDHKYVQEVGVGECAGASYDLVSTIMSDADERISSAASSLEEEDWAATIYWSYSAMVIGAKGLLLGNDIRCNTHQGIIDDFQEYFIDQGLFTEFPDLTQKIISLQSSKPSATFAKDYFQYAQLVLTAFVNHRTKKTSTDKFVIASHYNA